MANHSLCDSCLYAGSCADSDKGLSFANHTICWKYVDQDNFTRPTGGQVVPDTLQGWRYEERPIGSRIVPDVLQGWKYQEAENEKDNI
jgi:hypothetical protein